MMPASTAILVDAHNVIHQDPALRVLMGEPEIARRRLELLLAGREQVHLFYDGGPGGRPAVSVRHGLRIEYSGAGEADDCICHWLQVHHGARAMVVSDDRQLRRRARVLGATCIDARGFIARSVHQNPRRGGSGKPEPTAAEVAFWLEIFGE